jgi:protein translocase SecG subunit
MGIVENIWIVNMIIIVCFILLTDPKTSSGGGSSNSSLNTLFSSNISEGQKSLRTFIWFLIFCFYILTLIISYN